jgi:hypothetical protein
MKRSDRKRRLRRASTLCLAAVTLITLASCILVSGCIAIC